MLAAPGQEQVHASEPGNAAHLRIHRRLHQAAGDGGIDRIAAFAERIGAGDAQVGYVTTAMLFTQVLGTLATTRLVNCWGNRAALLLASVLVALSMAIVPFTASVWSLMALQGLGGVGRGVANTVLIALSLQAIAPEDRATGMGVYQAIYAFGMFAGPAVSGYLAQAAGLDAVFHLAAAVSLAGGFLGLLRTIPSRPG